MYPKNLIDKMPTLRTNIEPFSQVANGDDILGLSRPTAHQPEGIVCLAVTKRGTRRWEPLHDLSGANWLQLRDIIEEEVRVSLLEGLNRPPPLPTAPSAKCGPPKTTMKDFYTALYAKDPKAAKVLLRKHTGANGLNRRVCVNCFQWKGRSAQLGPRCIHEDCPGMCDECFGAKAESKCCDTCRVCARKSERDCPVCLETKPADEFNPSETCSHHVCFKCCFRAERAGHPIRNCPLCRSSFASCQNYTPTNYNMPWPTNTTSLSPYFGHSGLGNEPGSLLQSFSTWPQNDLATPESLDHVSDDDINRIATALFQ